jgi:5-methylcytosine-specific restriction endonuclease McrA
LSKNTKEQKQKASWYRRDKKANPIKYRLKNIYSMFKRRDGLDLTEDEKAQIAFRFESHLGTACHYCGETTTVKNLSCDHIVPISRGGTNEQTNLQFICLGCNFEKGNLTGDEYQTLVAFLNKYGEMRKIIRTRLKMSGIVFAHRK